MRRRLPIGLLSILLVGPWTMGLAAQEPVERMTLRLRYREPVAISDPYNVHLDVSMRIITNPAVVDLDEVERVVVMDPYGVHYELPTERYREGDDRVNAWPWWARHHVHESASAVALGWYDISFLDEVGREVASDRVSVLLDRQEVRSGFLTREEKEAYEETLALVGIPGREDGVVADQPYRYIPAIHPAGDVMVSRRRETEGGGFTVTFRVDDPRAEDGEIILLGDDGEIVAETNYLIEDRTRGWSGFTDAVTLKDDAAIVTLELPEDDWVLADGRTLDEAVLGYVELRNRHVRVVTRTRAEVAMWVNSYATQISEAR